MTAPTNSGIGPGAYDDGKDFGKDVKSFKFRENSKEKEPDRSGGPGRYDTNDSPTRFRNPAVIISKPTVT